MQTLPWAARIYVSLVVVLGALLVGWLGPRATFDDPLLFTILLLLSAVTSAQRAIV